VIQDSVCKTSTFTSSNLIIRVEACVYIIFLAHC